MRLPKAALSPAATLRAISGVERSYPATYACAVSKRRAAERRASGRGADEALRRAYPLIPERVDEDTLDFDYEDPGRGESPVDWNYNSRMLIYTS